MSVEPKTTEEYIEQVQRNAADQSEEKVVSHQYIRAKYEKEKNHYEEKIKFYSFLLFVIVLAYIGVHIIPAIFPENSGQSGST